MLFSTKIVALVASSLAITSVAGAPGYGSAPPAGSGSSVESGQKLAQLNRDGNANLLKYRLKHKSANGCSIKKTAVRKNFVKMPKWQRKQFTDAVTCLMKKPTTTTDPAKYPGVKSRYDDWPAAHIEFDNLIHFTAQFLHWHRYAIWAFEQDLRTQCGYRGYLPYWDWSADAQNPAAAEIFNGDAYSMGSNGKYVRRDTGAVFTVPLPADFLQSLPNPQQNVSLPVNSGTGGGCINANGPFGGNKVAHIGPTLVDFYGTGATGFTDDVFKYNPRCIIRDINPWVTRNYLTYRNVTETITNSSSIGLFQGLVQSDSRYKETIGNIGVHAGGHLGAGGDPMADQPSTPGDPIWFLHHASIDRMWNIWQAQDLDNRVNTVADTLTILNFPASRDATLEDEVTLNYIGGTKFPPSTIGGLSKSWDGPFCYIYD